MTSQQARAAEIEAMARKFYLAMREAVPGDPHGETFDTQPAEFIVEQKKLCAALMKHGLAFCDTVREECAKTAQAICSKYGEGAVGAKAAAAIREGR